MSVEHFVKEGGEMASTFLRLTQASEDVFPPLKTAASGALQIAEMVFKFKSNQAVWNEFGQYVRDVIACLICSLPYARKSREDLRRNLENLRDALDHIRGNIDSLQNISFYRRLLNYTNDEESILGLRQELQDALGPFHLGSISAGFDVVAMLKDLDFQCHLERVTSKLSGEIAARIVYDPTLNALPYAVGASWNSSCVCLDKTRVALLEEIWTWINSSTATTAEIFWITDVVGAGKSVLAHTVAQRCYLHGLLASSFFFGREDEERNKSNMLFTTIAHDLASLDAALARKICLAIQDDRSLPMAPIFRQFNKLILEPSLRYLGEKPVVIIIDALDEGCSTGLLKVLRDEIPKLPRNFRIFLTSRSENEIDFFLSNQSHIRSRMINIHEEANQTDIAFYGQFKLQDIAKQKHLHTNWPGPEISSEFARKADGLFLWMSTMSNYLRLSNNPVNDLSSLFSEYNGSNIPAEAKMDSLYATILGTCNWDDVYFVAGYRLVMGAVIAAKNPLSSSALHSLDPTLKIRDVLSQLGSLVDGWMEESRPIRLIHGSLRDFLTLRAHSSPDTSRFYIDVTEHSQRLALHCVLTLNQGFEQDISGLGYLSDDASKIDEIPKISANDISEAFWYACRFWIDHVIMVKAPASALINALQRFLSTQLVHWVELMTSQARFLNLCGVWNWVLEKLPEEHDIMVTVFNPDLARSLDKLSACLSISGRQEEALRAADDAVKLYQRLTETNSAAFNPGLANSLHNLSCRLSDLRRREEALQAMEDAVKLRQRLAEEHPATFNPDLAMSLQNLSIRLSNFGRRDEALQAIEDATRLHRQLAEENPAAFNPDLATSLKNLSFRLSECERREEALQAIENSVKLYAQLAEEQPATFNPNLAASLKDLSLRLSLCGRRDEALDAIEKSLQLYRPLAEERPATFNSDLATSLRHLSRRLSECGRREEALDAIEKSLELYRLLAEERPLTFNQGLSMALSGLAFRLSDLGRREEAMQAIEESLKLYRPLAEERPLAFNEGLAFLLENLSTLLADCGQRKQALDVIEDAIKIYRHLAETYPAAMNPNLARSLNNLSICLYDVGRQEEALRAIEESIKLYQPLTEDCPLAFNDGLAGSLNVLSTYMSELGRHEEALQAIEDSVKLCRRLTKEYPAVFNSDLATSLNNLSHSLSELGRQEEALLAVEEAVELSRRLARENPASFNLYLAGSLNNLSNHLCNLSRQEEGLLAVEEAVKLHRRLAEESPATFNPDLAMSLSNLSLRLSDLGQQEEALQIITEAVELRRQLAQDHPAAFNASLAGSLNNLSICLFRLDRDPEAIRFAEEAEKLLRSNT